MCCPCMFSTNVNLWMLRRTHFSFWFIKPPFRLSLPFSSIPRVRTIRITVFDQFGISVYVTHMCSPYQHVPHEHKKPFLLSFWGFRQTGGGTPKSSIWMWFSWMFHCKLSILGTPMENSHFHHEPLPLMSSGLRLKVWLPITKPNSCDNSGIWNVLSADVRGKQQEVW